MNINAAVRLMIASTVLGAVCVGCASSGPPSESAGDVIPTVSDADTRPRRIACPGYQPLPQGLIGTMGINVQVLVTPDGTVAQTRVAFSGNQSRLRDEAISLAESCVFEPATEAGVPVAAWTTVRFVLRFGN